MGLCEAESADGAAEIVGTVILNRTHESCGNPHYNFEKSALIFSENLLSQQRYFSWKADQLCCSL